MYRRNFSEKIIPITQVKWILSTFKESLSFPIFCSKLTGLYIPVCQICTNQFFQQVQQADLETRYITLPYGIGHNLSPELSTFALSAPWL